MPDRHPYSRPRPPRPIFKTDDPHMPATRAYLRAMLPGVACVAVLVALVCAAILWAPATSLP